jgi:ABC-type bacteriocin/lantibiotic exporter with double-glycine peptidase domain
MNETEDNPNIIIQLLISYFKEEKYIAIALVFLSLVVNGIQAQGISRITAEIVQSVEKTNKTQTIKVFKYLCIAFFLFLLISYVYTHLQNILLTKMRQWLRYNMLNILLESNKENMDEINYPRISSPINRAASICFMLFNVIFSLILPDISFILIVAVFLLMSQFHLGAIFLTGNLIMVLIIALGWSTMFSKNRIAVDVEYDNEAHLLEILHNFDKIIYRGQTKYESEVFEKKSKDAFSKALDFQTTSETYGLYVNFIVSILVAIILWLLIHLFYSKEVNITYFLTALTMLILYRDKMSGIVHTIPDCVEFVGRTDTVLKHFKNISLKNMNRNFDKKELPFHLIEFDNVSFKYKSNVADVVSGTSITLNTQNHDIIGITGLSGKGKTTIMKILLKMHSAKDGKVYIDGVNIDDISPDYIRENITYVSQNGKLFDRVVAENMLYGCLHPETCTAELKHMLKYPKIRELFKNVDVANSKSGNLGENLSGGQRQVVNIVGGLINPSKILILDEPTNALDAALKMEIMQLIQDYSVKKNAVIIITHDKEMYPIFNTTVKL